MSAITSLFYFLCILSLARASGLESLRNFFYKTISSSAIYDITNAEKSISKRNAPANYCDENKLMLTLANLELISPERLLLVLISFESSIQVCSEVTTTIRTIKSDQRDCRPLDDDNLYMMLFNGLKMLEVVFCKDESYQKKFDDSAPCLRELREEYVDCEGPADWFEFPNQTVVCNTFVDIVTCDYVKTAELCGIDIGNFLYCITTKVIAAVLRYPCKLPKDMPKIKAFAAELSARSSRLSPINTLILVIIILEAGFQ